jgi:hypothetical protein
MKLSPKAQNLVDQYDVGQLAEMVVELQKALKYCQDDKEVMQNAIDVYDSHKAVTDSEQSRYVPPLAKHLFEVEDGDGV